MGNSQTGTLPRATLGGRVLHYYSTDAWIDGRAEAQLAGCLDLPGVLQVAGYPDLHPGRHGPVGAAILARNLHPLLVGSDIGCGMALFALDLPRRRFSPDKAARRLRVLEDPFDAAADALAAAGLDPACASGLGSIGGGNHFCEIQQVDAIAEDAVDALAGLGLTKGGLCLLVHSGSRGWGERVLRRHENPKGLDPDSDEGRRYLTDHDHAVRWAALNRQVIAARAAQALNCGLSLIADAPHNLVVPVAEGWLHRKGAAQALRGFVPLAGSRDSHSYVLAVTGAADQPFLSLAHGAGRKHDRSAMHGRLTKNRRTLEALTRNGFGGHVVCEDADLLIEEAGSAYKSAALVARDLAALGLAEIAAVTVPLLTYKRAGEVRR